MECYLFKFVCAVAFSLLQTLNGAQTPDIYMLHFPNDYVGTKLTGKHMGLTLSIYAVSHLSLPVATLFFLETLFVVLDIVSQWNSNFGRGWGDIESLVVINWPGISLSFLNGLSE